MAENQNHVIFLSGDKINKDEIDLNAITHADRDVIPLLQELYIFAKQRGLDPFTFEEFQNLGNTCGYYMSNLVNYGILAKITIAEIGKIHYDWRNDKWVNYTTKISKEYYFTNRFIDLLK